MNGSHNSYNSNYNSYNSDELVREKERLQKIHYRLTQQVEQSTKELDYTRYIYSYCDFCNDQVLDTEPIRVSCRIDKNNKLNTVRIPPRVRRLIKRFCDPIAAGFVFDLQKTLQHANKIVYRNRKLRLEILTTTGVLN